MVAQPGNVARLAMSNALPKSNPRVPARLLMGRRLARDLELGDSQLSACGLVLRGEPRTLTTRFRLSVLPEPPGSRDLSVCFREVMRGY